MFTISIKSLTMCALISIAWYFGFTQLWYSITHFTSEWPWIVASIILSAMLNEWFMHNALAHRRYHVDPSRWLYKILVFLVTIDLGVGSPRRFALVHKAHHRWADIPGVDFLRPADHWFTGCINSPLIWIYQKRVKFPNDKEYFQREREKFSHIINDPWTIFCDTYTAPITILTWTVLYFVCPILLFKLLFMSRVMFSLEKFFLDIVGHVKLPGSYRNFNVRDSSHNWILSHYLFLGMVTSLLHNNHHGFPEGPKGHRPHTRRWFEIDLGYYGVELMRPWLIPKKH